MLRRRVRRGDRVLISGPATVHVLESSGKLELGIEADGATKILFEHKAGFSTPHKPEDDRRQQAGF